MKIKIVSFILCVLLLTASLTSCLFFDVVGDGENPPQTVGDATVNVGEVNNHDIIINSSATAGELAASKALLSAVSIKTGSASGSGVIFKMSEDKSTAYILTNYHVVYDSRDRKSVV